MYQQLGPEVIDGFSVTATKRTETMWHVLSGPYSLIVSDGNFKHAIVTEFENGMSGVRARTTSAPDVPAAQKAAILKALAVWESNEQTSH